MSESNRPGALRRSCHPTVAMAVVAVVAACQAPSPTPAPERAIADALGIDDCVAFHVEGDPLDVPISANALSLEDAVRRCVAHDPAIQAALARVRIAWADAEQARLLPNPVLNFILRWGPGTPQIEVSLAQDLVAALKIPNRASAADHRLRIAVADSATVALDAVAEVQSAYVSAQASDALVPILEQQADLLGRLVEVATARIEFGEGTRADVLTLQAQRVGIEVAIADARLDAREERLHIARLIGAPTDAASWTLDAWSPPDADARFHGGTDAEWIDLALARRPEVQAIVWELSALGDDAALARLAPWDGAGIGVDAQKDGDWTVGPSIATPVPVFDMGQAAKARVAAQQAEARHRLTQARREVVESVRSAREALRSHLANLERVRSELLPLEDARRRQAESAFRSGQSDVTALFLAEQGVRAADAKAIEVEREASLARVKLERAIGGAGGAPSRTVAGHESDSGRSTQ